jgi:hypothetical protein
VKVLWTLDSTAHYGYHESTIRALGRRGHAVRFYAKEGAVSPFDRVLDRLGGDDGAAHGGGLDHSPVGSLAPAIAGH